MYTDKTTLYFDEKWYQQKTNFWLVWVKKINNAAEEINVETFLVVTGVCYRSHWKNDSTLVSHNLTLLEGFHGKDKNLCMCWLFKAGKFT